MTVDRPRGRHRGLLALGAFVAGLVVTWWLTVRVVHGLEGYVPGEADCDDCGLTLLLDNVGWLALALVAYLAVAALVWRRFSSSGGASSRGSRGARRPGASPGR